MKLNYLKGDKRYFAKFLENISAEDNCLILSHTDLDGILSALLLAEILKSQRKNIYEIKFLNYSVNLLSDLIAEIKEKNISKIFISDLGLDNQYADFASFCNDFDVFYIDHHPLNENLDCENIIKTETVDCASMIIYDLAQDYISREKWDKLLHAAMISDFSYKKKENFEYLKSFYSDLSLENIGRSEAAILADKISNALVYYKDDVKKVFDILEKGNFEELDKADFIIEQELKKHLDKLKNNAIFFEDENLYFYELNSDYALASILSTLFSQLKNNSTVLVLAKENNAYKISARNQSGNRNMKDLLQGLLANLSSVSYGGHKEAASGKFTFSDLEKVKKRIGF